ncbi:MAG: glutaredoxin family protein [Deltaproteobacteria bacterium]|nr:glutaredoxin family protein [Deltaproteobacteria bacterium]
MRMSKLRPTALLRILVIAAAVATALSCGSPCERAPRKTDASPPVRADAPELVEAFAAIESAVFGLVGERELRYACAAPGSAKAQELASRQAAGAYAGGEVLLGEAYCQGLLAFWRRRFDFDGGVIDGSMLRGIVVALHEIVHAMEGPGGSALAEGAVHEVATHLMPGVVSRASNGTLPSGWREEVGLLRLAMAPGYQAYEAHPASSRLGDRSSGLAWSSVAALAFDFGSESCERGHGPYLPAVAKLLAGNRNAWPGMLSKKIADRHGCTGGAKHLERALSEPTVYPEKLLHAFRSDCPKATMKVVVYGAAWCGPCKQVVNYLKKRGIPFTWVDIDKENGSVWKFTLLSGEKASGIPVIGVNGSYISGFDPAQIEQLLEGPRAPDFADRVVFRWNGTGEAGPIGTVDLSLHEDGTHRDRGRRLRLAATADVAYEFHIPMSDHLAVKFESRDLAHSEISCQDRICTVRVSRK